MNTKKQAIAKRMALHFNEKGKPISKKAKKGTMVYDKSGYPIMRK